MATETDVIASIQGLSQTEVREWVQFGWVTPSKSSSGYYFTDIDVARIQLILDLRSNLQINNDAVPIVLSLIDQVHGLRHELRSLARAVETQHKDVQRSILNTLKANIDESE